MKQHKHPCKTCPFRRDSEPTECPGRSPLEVYVAQTLLPFRIPCHELIDYDDPDWHSNCDGVAQCAGHAMLRDAVGVADRMPEAMLHVKHEPVVFSSLQEFWAHHKQISIAEATDELTVAVVADYARRELQRSGLRSVGRPA